MKREKPSMAVRRLRMQQVLGVLLKAGGERVLKEELQERTGLHERCVRLAIHDLIVAGEQPVVADNYPAGYRILWDPAEMEKYCASMLRRGTAIINRAAKLQEIVGRPGPRQGALWNFEGKRP